MRCLTALLTLIMSSVMCACEPDLIPATQILINVENEFGDELRSLQVEIFDVQESAASDMETYPVQGLRTFTFAVVPAPERPQDSVLVVVRGLDADDDVLAEAKTVVSFVSGEKRGLGMVLSDGCRGQVCGPSQMCSAATNFACSATSESATTPLAATGDAGNGITTDPVTSGEGGASVVAPSADAATKDAGTTKDAGQAQDAAMDAAPNPQGSDAGALDSGTDAQSASDSGAAPTADAAPVRTACCPSGDCLCREGPPASLAFANGAYQTAPLSVSTGTVYYPTNAPAPFAALAMVSDFLRDGSELAALGQFFASHGIVAMTTTTPANASQDERATLLVAALASLKGEQTREDSPLRGKLSGRYGILGYSMGGGAALTVAKMDRTLRSVVGYAVHTGDIAGDPRTFSASGITSPTLLYCGVDDVPSPCSAYTDPSYVEIANTTPKLKILVATTPHADYPLLTKATGATAAMHALAFQKLFLEGDQRWKMPLLSTSAGGVTTNIQ